MKKIILIIVLIIFNVLLIYSKVSGKNNINLNLKDEELAIVVIDNINSKSLLLLKNNQTILYILEYNDDKDLIKDLDKFTYSFDYIFKSENFKTSFSNDMIINNNMIDDIYISKNQIRYMNYSFCINESHCDFTYLSKVRLGPDKVETKIASEEGIRQVKGKSAVVVDDIIATGGTIVNAIGILKDNGASDVSVCCVHPTLVNDAVLKIYAAGARDLAGTDTIKSDVSSISVASIIASALKGE